MKKIIVFAFFTMLIFKAQAQQEELAHWILSLDSEIRIFEEKTKVKKETLDTVNNVPVKTVWFKKKKKIYKIQKFYYYLKEQPAIFTYYLKNNNLIKHTVSGVFPKTEKEPELYIFDNNIYFDGKDKVFKQSKKHKLMAKNAFYASYVEMLKLSYTVKEFKAKDAQEEYNSLYKGIEDILIE